MLRACCRFAIAAALLSIAPFAPAASPVVLADKPALSPDGRTLAFDWNGDIWRVPVEGGKATVLTRHPGKDLSPSFSPDGKEIAFLSDREGGFQVFTMPAEGGSPKQATFHSSGYGLYEWTGDGRILTGGARDHAWYPRHSARLFVIDPKIRRNEQMLFDDYALQGTLSPDGKKVLFVREGVEWWRKGYKGTQAPQIWLYDRDSKLFTSLIADEIGASSPMWKPDGKGFYFTSGRSGSINLWESDLAGKAPRPITKFTDDSVVFPCISRDGTTIVFRYLFDLYKIQPGRDETPRKIDITREDDRPIDRTDRRTLLTAKEASFTGDGLEVAFTAGGDLWVMDTELREPKQITRTGEDERSPLFAADGKSIYYITDVGGSPELWKAEKGDAARYWWQNSKFVLTKLTSDGQAKTGLSLSPDGTRIGYIAGRGQLFMADLDGKNPKRLIDSWNAPSYDWSPDGKWIVYALSDNDFNRDIWIAPVDGSKPAFNVSRHPYNEDDPVWSPDGKLIAWVGARDSKDTTDIHYVWLAAADDQRSARDKALEAALDKMKRTRPTGPPVLPMGPPIKEGDNDQTPVTEVPPAPKSVPSKVEPALGKSKEVKIDFEGLHDRVRRVTIAGSNESDLFWSPDSKKLAFASGTEDKRGTYTIDFPEGAKPTQISSATGSNPQWLRNGTIVWLSAGIPGSFSPGSGIAVGPSAPPPASPTAGARGPRAVAPTTPSTASPTPGEGTSYRFAASQEIDLSARNRAAFDTAWRIMRDNWYDSKVNNRDWNAVRAKYSAVAADVDLDGVAVLIQMMLGELNGSHLGFSLGAGPLSGPRPDPAADPGTGRKWSLPTAHPGVRFVDGYAGPGVKIRDVIPGGPADSERSRLFAGETILSVDGVDIMPPMDLTTVFNVPPGSELLLKVRDKDLKDREVSLRPTTYPLVRTLLYTKWIRDNRSAVETMSKGTLGYLHIQAMDQKSFIRFQEDLHAAGYGKDGLVIDVRTNGGGSTADLLLTCLTQPTHAIAVPRGGGPGYPQDRTIFATWNKPIVVLCDQNSFSNAEIFSHAIKTLKRGKLVGVQTAGGVISTGATPVMDIGQMRLPFRGWYLPDTGEDMELNGAKPDVTLWPTPGEFFTGKDTQLAKGVEVLMGDVKEYKAKPPVKVRNAAERRVPGQ